MLILSRKEGERIVIGENIELVVVAVQGGRVKLGFRAPHDVKILREEISHRTGDTFAPLGEEVVKRQSSCLVAAE